MNLAQLIALAPTVSFALAVLVTVAYMLGRRSRPLFRELDGAPLELKRARAVVRELERIAQAVRRDLATHHTGILQFKERIGELSRQQDKKTWSELTEEAERILKPTLKLSTQIARAYDELRHQTNLLMSFTEIRTDPLTGLSNRRGMEETLRMLLAMLSRYQKPFSLAILDIDHFKKLNDELGHLHGDQVLQQCARTLEQSLRDTDMVVRFGGEEFVILMPETDLQGAGRVCERVRKQIHTEVGVTVSTGVTQAQTDDNAESLLSRADSALYSAKAAGRNTSFQHCGRRIDPVGSADSPSEPESREPLTLRQSDLPADEFYSTSPYLECLLPVEEKG